MDGFFENAFSPLGPVYCDYFLYLSMINLFLFFYVIASAVYMFFFAKGKEHFYNVLLVSFPVFLGYFTNRLMYSMCSRSLTSN